MAAVATEAVFDVSKVALNLGSKCVPSLVKAIFTSAKEIRETVRRINNCDEQCVRLSKRIDRLSDVLQKQQFPDTINESIEQALQDFEDFLEKCLKIDEKEKKTSQESIFDSGIWKYRRGVDEQWQDSYYCNLIFNRDTRALVGCGEDNFGYFTISGTFTERIRTIQMDLSYIDEQSDIINEETIRLIYDKDRKIFCGMMYPREATTQEAYESSRLFEISIDDPW
ncbi:unnamed protein product [Rotaria sordida]|uniref:Mixed lineage kinase domain-containing protein n=1 Tax=Rotaria sordida TaxID=392033 RepID=A0A815RW80_9BILA|nr:unnamed protein product [Rotaria sordida]